MCPMRVESDSFDPETAAAIGAAAQMRERRAHQVRKERKRVIAAECLGRNLIDIWRALYIGGGWIGASQKAC